MFGSILSIDMAVVETTVNLAGAFIFGIMIAFTYIKNGGVSKNFARTMVILPLLVSIVMTVVNGDLGASVAVMGAFSLVRFRSMQGTSTDIAYVFFAMAAGLLSSMGHIIFGIAFVLAVCLIMFVMHRINFGAVEQAERELRITIPEDLDYTEIFDNIFEAYTTKNELVRMKTTNMGSMYELCYHIRLKDLKQEKEMIDAIRCRNGNLTIISGRLGIDRTEL